MRMNEKEIKDFVVKHNIYFENNKWFGERFCPNCEKIIKCIANERYYLIRNIKIYENKKAFCLNCFQNSMKGNKNPFFGKKHSDKTKKQVSESRKGKACGKDNSMNNPENRKKISLSLKKKYASGDLDYLKKIQRDFAIKHQTDGTFKSCLVSKIESEIGKKFNEIGTKFETQFKITSKPYDFYFPEKNLLVEFNGDYFHANPNKYDANYYNKKKGMFAHELWAQDELKKKEALDKGYNFLTIWEEDYKKDKDLTINKIKNYGE